MLRRSIGIAGNASGGVAVTFALSAMFLVCTVGMTIDYARLTNMRQKMQNAADAAAFAGAKELSLADARRENVPEVVKAVVQSYIDADSGRNSVSSATVKDNPLQVEVTLATSIELFFGGLFGKDSSDVSVVSVAQVMGRPNICVLALNPSESGAVSMMHAARMTGSNCAVFSNSSSGSGLIVQDSAQLTAATVCSAGGITGRGSIAPPPYQDCPHFDDPLADRPEPASSRCDHTQKVISNSTVLLQPGVYCSGLKIMGTSKVTFAPGVYVIKDGPFTVAGQSEIVGHGVGFFLAGESNFFFNGQTSVELSAPTSGPLAGLLFFGSRSQSDRMTSTIRSAKAQVLTGTIYLPRATLVVDSIGSVATDSAYTAIVVRSLKLFDGPHLVLNTRYSDTAVPVPEGIKSAGQPVRLVE
jgi:Flp pilus assembly protein TadG